MYVDYLHMVNHFTQNIPVIFNARDCIGQIDKWKYIMYCNKGPLLLYSNRSHFQQHVTETNVIILPRKGERLYNSQIGLFIGFNDNKPNAASTLELLYFQHLEVNNYNFMSASKFFDRMWMLELRMLNYTSCSKS